MKKFRTLLSMLLVLSILASLSAVTTAEDQSGEEWQADIRTLMDEANLPRTTTAQYEVTWPEGVEADRHTHKVERMDGDGLTVCVEFAVQTDAGFEKADWTAMDEWLDGIVDHALIGVEKDTVKIVRAVIDAVDEAIGSAQPDEEGNLPVWAEKNWVMESVAVTMPYYPELSDGVNGAATQRLQQRLIQLGFLNDTADGYFGPKTENAVEELEEYVRELEQDVIDARETPEPTPQPTPEPTPQPDEINGMLTFDWLATATAAPPETEESEEPEEEAEPTPTPVPAPTPVTPVDGVADALLQAYLFSDDYVPARMPLENGDSGAAVLRLQRKLIMLGYMADAADGEYGGSTARSVRIFQYYNNLPLTGVADLTTQNLLFSENAAEPDNRMLAVGSTGDSVSKLQQRLYVLGFMNGSVDGDFGKTTRDGVENLQEYMRACEEAALREDAAVMAELEASGGDIASLLTVEINGIADPMLLDDFYSESFTEIPETLQNGSSGPDVVRLQRRLRGLEYYYSSIDGEYGGGTESAIKTFQKRHGLEQTGIADYETLALLFSADALKALKPYVLKISTADQRVYAYGLDANNEHTVLVRTMKCSTGRNETPTPKGTFQAGTGPGARWHYFKKFDCWAQYAYYIQGDIMFHSVLYNEKNGPVTQSSVNNLGRKASHGCVRLSVEDARWVYNNCPRNTKIIVY